MSKKRFNLCFYMLFVFVCFFCFNFSYATDNVNLKEKKEDVLEIESEDLDITKIITEYENLTKEYSNDEIANIIEKNSNVLEQKGINSDEIIKLAQILRNLEPEKITEILKEDIKIDNIKENLTQRYTLTQVLEDAIDKLSTKEKINICIKLLFSNKYFKIFIFSTLILTIYSVILKWIIFNKAGKPGFISIIPIYRDVIYYSICNISPWVLICAIIPVIGWIVLLIIKIISRFKLAYSFGKKVEFGLGLWIFPILFESIIAFSKKIKYSGEE